MVYLNDSFKANKANKARHANEATQESSSAPRSLGEQSAARPGIARAPVQSRHLETALKS